MPTPNNGENENEVIVTPSSESGDDSQNDSGENQNGEDGGSESDQNGSEKNQSHNSGGKSKTEEEMTDEERAAQKANEDFILNFKEEDMEDDDKRNELAEALKNAKTTVYQKRHYRQKLADYEKKNMPLADAPVQKPSEAKGADKPQVADNSRELVIELRQDNPWMTKEVAQEVVRQAKANNESVTKTVQRPMVKDWLKKEKASAQAQDASVAPEQKGAPSEGDTIADRDWSKASFDEVLKQHQKTMNRGA